MQESTLIIAKGGSVTWDVPPRFVGGQMDAPTGGAAVILNGATPIYPLTLADGMVLTISAPNADGQVPIRIPDGPPPLDLTGATPEGGLITDLYANHTLLSVDGPAVTAEHSSDGVSWTLLNPPAVVPPGHLRLTRTDASGWLSRVRFAAGAGQSQPGDEEPWPERPPSLGTLSSGGSYAVPAQAAAWYGLALDQAATVTLTASAFAPNSGGWLIITPPGGSLLDMIADVRLSADPTQLTAQLGAGLYEVQVNLDPDNLYPLTLHAEWSAAEPIEPQPPAGNVLLNGQPKEVDFGINYSVELFIDLDAPATVTVHAVTTYTEEIPHLMVQLSEGVQEGEYISYVMRDYKNLNAGPEATLLYTLPAGRHLVEAERLDSLADLTLTATW